MRLLARIPADLGRVEQITVRLEYDGTLAADGIDITDVQLQPGDASGVVPNPADLAPRVGSRQWRNGVIPSSTDEVIILSNADRPVPTRVDVHSAGSAVIRVGSFRFGRVISPVWADAETGRAARGWGRPPVLTERSDGHVAVETDRPLHMTVGWSDRS